MADRKGHYFPTTPSGQLGVLCRLAEMTRTTENLHFRAHLTSSHASDWGPIYLEGRSVKVCGFRQTPVGALGRGGHLWSPGQRPLRPLQ